MSMISQELINLRSLLYYRQGNTNYEAGYIEVSIQDYDYAIRLNPNHADFYSRRGKAHYDIGNIQAAISDCTQAIRLNSNHVVARQNLCLANSKLHEIQEVRTISNSNVITSNTIDFHQINNTQLSRDSSQNIQWTDISTSKVSGTAIFDDEFLIGRNQNNNLEEQLSNLIGQKDRVSQEIFRAGEKVYFCISCQLGYHEDSWQYLNQTCEQCESSNVSMYNLQLTCVKEKKEVTFTELSSINADDLFLNADDLFSWGCEKLKREDYIGAIEDFTKALQINPNNSNNYEIYLNRGITYYKLKNYNAAIEDYTSAIRINSNNVNAYYNRGNVYYKIENLPQAINDYNQALRIEPFHDRAKRKLDLARYKLQKTQQLITSSSNNYKILNTTEINYADYLDYLFQQGVEKIKIKDYRTAIQYLTKALDFFPKNQTEVYYNRGYAYYRLKKYYEAIEDYNRVIILNYQHANAYANRGNVYYLLGDMQAAIDDYNQALSINRPSSSKNKLKFSTLKA